MASPILTYLSKEELESIHLASCRILEKTGVRFPNKQALNLFSEGGAKVHNSSSLVKIPSKMVEDALEKVPREIHLYARDPKKDIHVTDIKRRWPFFGVQLGTTHVLNMKTKKRRPATVNDLADCITIVDACENMDFTEAIISPQDVPLELTWQHAFNITFRNCSKPVVWTVEGLEITRDIIEMAIAVAGGENEFRKRPLLSFVVLTLPPLNNDPDAVACILEGIKYGIQIRVSAGTMAGASSPVTLAGCLAQANAEALSWMVLVQLANPGHPFVFGLNPRIMDMRYGTVSLSSPEWALMRACVADIGRFYDLPSLAYQMVVPSKLVDAQAGYEKALTGLMAALGGLNLAGGFVMDSQNQTCPADIVFSDEIIGALRRILRGFEVNDETLALDLIHETGPGGNFVGTKHTLRHYKEHWHPTLLERRSWSEWSNDGAKDLWDRAVERAEQILTSHKAVPLSKKVCQELDHIVKTAEKRLELR